MNKEEKIREGFVFVCFGISLIANLVAICGLIFYGFNLLFVSLALLSWIPLTKGWNIVFDKNL